MTERRSYWLSTREMTVTVDVDELGAIVATPPVVAKFRGQPIANLISWMTRQGGLRIVGPTKR